MKLIRFGSPGRETPGLLQDDGIVDLRAHFPDIPDIDASFHVNNWINRISGLKAPGRKLNARLGPPVVAPSKIICLGKNYRDHALEGGMDVPSAPLLFCKSPNTLNGPYDPVLLPRSSGQIDWEVELAVVIGRQGKSITPADAATHIAGVTVFNDVSGRQAQFGDGQWFRGKSFDTFAPMGPSLVTLNEIGDLHTLDLTTEVNTQIMQKDNTGNMIFNVFEVISYISQDITLMPGDIIATGTPAGVGIFRKPPVEIQAGDEVRCWIEGIGAIRNQFVHANPAGRPLADPIIPAENDLLPRQP